MKRIGLASMGLLWGVWAIGCALAADPTPVAPAAGNAAELAPFQDELGRTDFPSHVEGLAVVEATVTAVDQILYCPFRTAQCGRNPTCDHPKKSMWKSTLTVTRALANPAGIGLPATLEYQVMEGKGPELHIGQRVFASFYAYRNGVPPQISRLVPAPESPAP